jgi:hypothetical protein
MLITVAAASVTPAAEGARLLTAPDTCPDSLWLGVDLQPPIN